MDLDVCRKKLKFRSWNYGTRELDLLLGGFADKYLAAFDAERLQLYENLLSRPLPDLYGWITGGVVVPAEEECDVLTDLVAHCREAAKSASEK